MDMQVNGVMIFPYGTYPGSQRRNALTCASSDTAALSSGLGSHDISSIHVESWCRAPQMCPGMPGLT